MSEEENKENLQEESLEPKKNKKPAVPYLLELSITLWQLLVLAVGVLTAVLSWLNGVEVLMITLRSGAAMLSLGALAWLTNWMLNQQMLEALVRFQESKKEEAAQENM